MPAPQAVASDYWTGPRDRRNCQGAGQSGSALATRAHGWLSAGRHRPIIRRAVGTVAWSACRSLRRHAINTRTGRCPEGAGSQELCPLLPDSEPRARIDNAERRVGQMRRIHQRAGGIERARVLHDAVSRRQRLAKGKYRLCISQVRQSGGPCSVDELARNRAAPVETEVSWF